MEEAIQSLPSTGSTSPDSATTPTVSASPSTPSFSASHVGEESAQPLSLPTPAQTLGEDARRFLQKTGDTISKPLSAISKIFSDVLDNAEESFPYLPGPFAPFELSREHQQRTSDAQGPNQDGIPGPQTPAAVPWQQQPIQIPYKQRVRRPPSSSTSPARSPGLLPAIPSDETPTRQGPNTNLTPDLFPHSRHILAGAGNSTPAAAQQPRLQSLIAYERDMHLSATPPSGTLSSSPSAQTAHVSRTPTPNLDIAGLQAEIDRAHERAAVASKETLRQIFPDVDDEVMGWVLEANEGDLGKSIEALLEMSSGA